MAKLEKVIFDTNFLRNTEPSNFLWWREQLKKFSNFADLLLPDMVIEELKNQKRRNLEKHKKNFLENPFHWLRNINKQDTEKFDSEAHILQLENEEDISYKTIYLTDNSVLWKIKELALKKLPPFEDSDSTDKWFKDAYIYFTILEYVEKNSDEYVFVCTWDWKLKDAFRKHSNIKIIKDFDDFEDQTTWYFKKPYFIDKLKEILPEDFESIWDISYNINNNWLVTVFTKDIDTYFVEVDYSTKDIIDYARKWDFNDIIQKIIVSDNFWDTHSNSKQLIKFCNYITDNEIILLFNAIFENYQIKWTFHHSVKELFWSLYENKKDLFNEEMKNEIDKLFE